MSVSQFGRAILLTGVTAGFLAGTGIANAGCAQTDLVGNWQFYIVTFDGSNVTDAGWVRCGVNIGATAANNVRLATGAVCKLDSGANVAITTTGSTLTVSPACSVTGTIRTNVANLTAAQITMSLDQTRLTGVGALTGGQLFMLNAEKY